MSDWHLPRRRLACGCPSPVPIRPRCWPSSPRSPGCGCCGCGCQPAELYPDEAQYWFWAKHLAFGYYSKPPLVAWLIALTTGLFGDSEFAVRLSAPLLAAATAVLVYAVGARLYDRRIGFWSALAFASLPGASVSAFIISTDAPLVLCWAAALYAFIRAREDDRWRWWLAAGIAAGFGLLAKYTMVYWMLSAVVSSCCPRRAPPPAAAARGNWRRCADRMRRICGGIGTTGSSAICILRTMLISTARCSTPTSYSNSSSRNSACSARFSSPG